jgi:prolyl-tRNA synthetase
MGVIAEKFADQKGLIWPDNIAPAKVYLVRIGTDKAVAKQSDELYERLTQQDVAVLYDDRDIRPGEKFADADLMGIPYRVVVSDKTMSAGAYELKARTAENAMNVSENELMKTLGVPA